MIATAQVACGKKHATGGSHDNSLGHGEDAFAPATQTDEKGRRDACPTWSPGAKDHVVYNLVKFGGQTQKLAAELLGISQPSVSRIIDRYERWQAHAQEREGGRLDHAERLRAQRWLTYERNELILASALRIAAEMEGFADVSKSVIARPISQPSREREIRTETSVIDRHGIAARFLRLAFRINMEQLKLVSLEAPPMPEPLSAEELAEQECAAATIAAEFEAAERAVAEAAEAERERVMEQDRAAQELAEQESAAREGEAARGEVEGQRGRQSIATTILHQPTSTPQLTPDPAGHAAGEGAAGPAPAESEAAAAEHIQPVNGMNKRCAGKSVASCERDCTCAAESRVQDFAKGSCAGRHLGTAASPEQRSTLD